VQVHQDPGEYKQHSAYRQQPADHTAPIPKEHRHSEQEWDQRYSETIRSVQVPVTTGHNDVIGQQVSPDATHEETDQKEAEAAGGAADIAEASVRRHVEIIKRHVADRRDIMAQLRPEENITTGMEREDALRIYAASVNQEDSLFTYLPSLPEKLNQMRGLLHDPISADEAYALNDVIYRRRRYCDMIAWLQDDPISWDGHFVREVFRAEESDRQLIEQWRKEDEDEANRGARSETNSWCTPEEAAEFRRQYLEGAKAEYLKFARPCPNCGTPPEFLEWYLDGGGLLTRCRFCLQQVSEFTLMIGTINRRLKRPAALLSRRGDLPV
jgi:hypothetical protein